MSDYSSCPLCGSPQTQDGDWRACACDEDLSRALTVRQAAAYLYKSPSGVYHLINDGYLAAIRDSRPRQVRIITLKSHVAAGYAWWRKLRRDRNNPDRDRA